MLHFPLMHDSDGCMKNLERFSIIFSLLLHVVQVDNYFLHGDKFLVKILMVSPNVDTSPSMVSLSSSRYTYEGFALWTSSWSCSICCLAACNLFSICLFSAMRYSIFELVALAKAKLAAIMASGFLLVSVTITVSLMNIGDVRLFENCFFLNCKIFFEAHHRLDCTYP